MRTPPYHPLPPIPSALSGDRWLAAPAPHTPLRSHRRLSAAALAEPALAQLRWPPLRSRDDGGAASSGLLPATSRPGLACSSGLAESVAFNGSSTPPGSTSRDFLRRCSTASLGSTFRLCELDLRRTSTLSSGSSASDRAPPLHVLQGRPLGRSHSVALGLHLASRRPRPSRPRPRLGRPAAGAASTHHCRTQLGHSLPPRRLLHRLRPRPTLVTAVPTRRSPGMDSP